MASLRSVPVELYEAARLDGAGPWKLFRHVTWPLISPVTFYNVVIALVALGQYFIVPYVLTDGNGDPNGATLFYTMYLYRQTFTFSQGGYGSAMAWAMAIVIMSATAVAVLVGQALGPLPVRAAMTAIMRSPATQAVLATRSLALARSHGASDDRDHRSAAVAAKPRGASATSTGAPAASSWAPP